MGLITRLRLPADFFLTVFGAAAFFFTFLLDDEPNTAFDMLLALTFLEIFFAIGGSFAHTSGLLVMIQK